MSSECRHPSARCVPTIVAVALSDDFGYDRSRKRRATIHTGIVLVVIALIATSGQAEPPAESSSLRLAETIPLEGVEGRIDHMADREQRIVTETWPVTAARANFPMALDEVHHRIFVVCRMPAKLLVIDSETGKTLSALNCCGDSDDIFYDESDHRVYVVGGEGCINVFEQVDADTYNLTEKVITARGARTALFVPVVRRLFVAVPHDDDQHPEIQGYETQPGQP